MIERFSWLHEIVIIHELYHHHFIIATNVLHVVLRSYNPYIDV